MNTQNTPKITVNNNNSNKNVKTYYSVEKTFKTKQELQAYVVDSALKNKRRSFNMNVVLI